MLFLGLRESKLFIECSSITPNRASAYPQFLDTLTRHPTLGSFEQRTPNPAAVKLSGYDQATKLRERVGFNSEREKHMNPSDH
jgi:hypothetical protein